MDHHCVVSPVPQNIKMNVVYQGNDMYALLDDAFCFVTYIRSVLLEIKESVSINEIVTLLKLGKFYKGIFNLSLVYADLT
jgi:hypothetical protein